MRGRSRWTWLLATAALALAGAVSGQEAAEQDDVSQAEQGNGAAQAEQEGAAPQGQQGDGAQQGQQGSAAQQARQDGAAPQTEQEDAAAQAADGAAARDGSGGAAAQEGSDSVAAQEGSDDAAAPDAADGAAAQNAADEEEPPYTVECGPDPEEGMEVCQVDRGTYVGWRTFHSICHTCHAQDAVGSTFAPALLPRIMAMDKARFIEVVDKGFTGQVGVMPGWAANPNVNRYYDELWSYLRARADGVLRPGRPKRLPDDE